MDSQETEFQSISATENSYQEIYLQSLGAAETVTGSKHLLRTPGLNMLIDCGLFQGIKSLREKNWETLPIKSSSISVIILTHAHLDHCGYLPLLIKNGYRGNIFMSKPTRDLAELILRDSAKIQEEDARKANEKGYTKHHPAKPLYTVADVEETLPYFKIIDVLEPYQIHEQVEIQFYPAGHILGACSVLINCYGRKILFSGDIGRPHSELLPAPTHPPEADFIIMESTYGDRLHETEDPGEVLALMIKETIMQQGNILIPCFAVGRAQEVMHLLYKLKKQNKIPESIPIFMDSPMAASASAILQKYPEWITISQSECDQMFKGVTINQDYRQTENIIRQKGSKIILAASGMLTGGRVLEYLKSYIGDSRHTILLMGYQAEGTRGRALLNNAHEIKIHGQYYPVKAQIREIGNFSAHADQAELISWLKEFKPAPDHILLVHGEPCAQDALRVKIKDELGIKVNIPKQNQIKFLFALEMQDLGVD